MDTTPNRKQTVTPSGNAAAEKALFERSTRSSCYNRRSASVAHSATKLSKAKDGRPRASKAARRSKTELTSAVASKAETLDPSSAEIETLRKIINDRAEELYPMNGGIPAFSTYAELKAIAKRMTKRLQAEMSQGHVETLRKAVKRRIANCERLSSYSSEVAWNKPGLTIQSKFMQCLNKYIKKDGKHLDTIYKLRFQAVDENGAPYGHLRANCSTANPNEIDFAVPGGNVDYSKKKLNNDSTEFEVERILDIQSVLLPSSKSTTFQAGKSHSTMYLVKWVNYPMDDCTWQHAKDFQQTDMLKSFKTRENALAALSERYNLKMPERNEGFHLSKEYRALNLFERQVNEVCRKFGQGPLYIENWVDKTTHPKNFEFVLESTFSEKAKTVLEKCDLRGACHCQDPECSTEELCCRRKKSPSAHAYRRNGLRLDKVSNYKDVTIWECCCTCICKLSKCSNKILQRGRQIPLLLFKTKEKKWGLYAVEKILKGTFICEYVGHVMTREEAVERNHPRYAFDLGDNGIAGMTTDAENSGNEGRFVNHSCDPNAAAIRAYVDFDSLDYHRIGYFAIKDISAGEEITIDYFVGAKKSKSSNTSGLRCLCGAKKCRGMFGC
ncbi:hypothetical protein QR680_012476 [Steinernema hermaphroditum]|uniref:Histone-lysine N-methyltransferase n=1 Tax=Steinernema hermaphroditum TaxID=289476 RepID=A0AA39I3R3_9BILA|nr:hypothetical protein QR680_012476 [Steinernema hermaphroditum]